MWIFESIIDKFLNKKRICQCRAVVKDKTSCRAVVKDKTSHAVTLGISASDGKEYEIKIESRDGVSDDIEEGDVIYV